MANKNYVTLISRIMTIVLIIACIILAIAGYQSGIFESVEALQAFIASAGLWGPLIFMFIQALQVIIPMLPGFVTCIAGALLFGPIYGFIYSYIGICAGSVAAFYLSRRYGTVIVKKLIKEETYNKYITWLDKGKKFDIIFLLAIFLPAAPDDVLCFVAGLTKIQWKKFVIIILLGKPFVIALYSVGTAGFSQILNIL